MPQWLKALLLLMGVGIIGFALVVFGIISWIRDNKGRIVSETSAAQAEGAAFGRTHTQDDCVGDALAQVASCGPLNLVCETRQRFRLGSCLRVAEKDGTCTKLPAPGKIFENAQWASNECVRRGQGGSQACNRLMAGLTPLCGIAEAPAPAPAPEAR